MSTIPLLTGVVIERLPTPGEEITPSYVDQLVASLQAAIDILDASRQRTFPEINLTNTQTHGAGLRIGDVFTDSGTLKIVQSGVGYAAPFAGTGSVGTVTVVTT